MPPKAPQRVPLAPPSQQKVVVARVTGAELAKRAGMQIGPDGLPVLARDLSFGQTGLKAKRISYSKAEVIELKCIFDKFDTDESGDVSVVEINLGIRNEKGRWQTLAQHLGDTLKEIKKQKISFLDLIKAVWPMGTKKDYNIMLEWTHPKGVEAPPEPPKFTAEQLDRIRSLFSMYDTDGSGALSPEEIRDAFQGKGFSGEDLTDLFLKYDVNNDAEINVEEFIAMMTETYMASSDAFKADLEKSASIKRDGPAAGPSS
eukprot:tig00020952_g16508.t1